MFKVKVHDPVAMALIIGSIALIAVGVILLLMLLKKASNRVSGCMRVVYIADGEIDSSGEYKSTKVIYENPNIDHDVDMSDNYEPADALGGFGNTLGGFGNTLGGFGNTSGGFGNTSGGFGDTSGSFGDTSGGFGDTSGGFGNTSGGFGSGWFGTEDDAIPKEETPKSSDSFGNSEEFSFGGTFSDASSDREDRKRSDMFDEKISIGGTRVRKTNISKVLKIFIEYYSDFMNAQNKDSRLCKNVVEYINDNFSNPFSRIHLLGTLYGKSGVILKVEKHLLQQKMLKIHSPKYFKKQASMNPNKGKVKLSLSVINGEKDNKGNSRCSHIEIEYSKKY